MSKGIIAVVSFFLTAAILVVGVSVVNASVTQKNQAQEVAPAPQDQALLQQMADRETAYRQLIDEANSRIEQLNQQVQTLNATAQVEQAKPALAPENAAQIALMAVENEDQLVQLPELVDYEGVEAYEVHMTKGLLYIDAQSGAVLFNNVPKRIDEKQAAEIAGQYLGGMDPRYAVVKIMTLNGSEIYQVNLNNYLVYIDPYGQVIKAQVYQYVDNSTNNTSGSSSSSSSSGHDDDHEEHDDDDD